MIIGLLVATRNVKETSSFSGTVSYNNNITSQIDLSGKKEKIYFRLSDKTFINLIRKKAKCDDVGYDAI